MDGWISLHRKIKDHWIWSSQNRFQWWIDILLTVNHSDTKVLIKGTLLDCKRGQSIRSLDTWAKDWNVTKKTVRDFFILLKKDGMLMYENVKISTRITVCNYESYQNEVNAKETPGKRKVNAKETLSKRELPTNNNVNKENNENNVNKENSFDLFWNEFHKITSRNKTDKEPTKKHWIKLNQIEQQKAIDSIKKYFDSLSDKKYCKKARTYLADKNFNDEFRKINGSSKSNEPRYNLL
jgi:hypothetical protein